MSTTTLYSQETEGMWNEMWKVYSNTSLIRPGSNKWGITKICKSQLSEVEGT